MQQHSTLPGVQPGAQTWLCQLPAATSPQLNPLLMTGSPAPEPSPSSPDGVLSRSAISVGKQMHHSIPPLMDALWGTDECMCSFCSLPPTAAPTLLPPTSLRPPGCPQPLPVAAAKISEELLSILILIGPFLIMMFLQQFQPIMVSQGY